MAQTINIQEFAQFPFINGHAGNVVEMPPLASQTVGVSGSSAQSSAFQNNTKLVRVQADNGGAGNIGCSIRFGTNPTAVSTDTRLAPNQTEYFFTQPGNKLAVIASTV